MCKGSEYKISCIVGINHAYSSNLFIRFYVFNGIVRTRSFYCMLFLKVEFGTYKNKRRKKLLKMLPTILKIY